MFDFQLLKKSKKSRARLGLLKTPHGQIKTPAFITVGTKGTVKSLTPQDLDAIGTQMVFINTYHIVLSPGVDVIEKAGGIHTFSGIDTPIITDSGGFQVFSLARNSKVGTKHKNELNSEEQPPHFVAITDDGVEFRSPRDGEMFYFTPEFSIDAQRRIGADFAVAFDECLYYGADYKKTEKSLRRTHDWAQRSLQVHKVQSQKSIKQEMYGVIQGGLYEDLRRESVKFISSFPFFGLAIGGVSVGETKKEMRDQIGWVMDELGDDPRPRHLLGIGEFDDVMDAVVMGIDTMDCVIPTRHARMGRFYVVQSPESYGEVDILKQVYKKDFAPIDEICECYTCHHFTRAYLHHLFKQRELLAYRLATIHNLFFMEQLFENIRESI
ncbi:MAG TPA: tRNA guanosine(34) transglycosylase Tgt [Patescibacteria group bacterium]|nr:tRNA guanosine(34) transglycosylase Tgt [Patescibacteria group bacterium]